jgi:hypothetical protein
VLFAVSSPQTPTHRLHEARAACHVAPDEMTLLLKSLRSLRSLRLKSAFIRVHLRLKI